MEKPEPPWFHDLYQKLLIADVTAQLPGRALAEVPELNEDDARKLLGIASALALEEQPRSRSVAYEIASRLVEVFGDQLPSVVSAADVVLSRLANFPGRSLLRKRYAPLQEAAPWAPTRLALERLVREIQNSVPGPDDQPVALTDFQYTLFRKLGEHRSVSVSAPTSAGKSFVMGLDIVRRLKKGGAACIIYLVPTRALIREVTFDVRRHLRQGGLESVPVRSVPFPIGLAEAPQGAVYVLTQERLISLLHSREGRPRVTALIVDEAQSIRDEARGVMLQTAIEAVLARFPDAEVHFASPLTKNPGFLLDLIGRPGDDGAFVETVSPVSQNLILVSEVSRKKTQASFVLLASDEQIDLGTRDLGFEMRGSTYKQRALVARAVTRDDEATILFANNPSDTEELAEALIEGQPAPGLPDPDIRELIDFIRADVHADYPLTRTLPHGVAYHYGFMPGLVRARVEDLFKAGKLRYVCCTSTLLQGVNLPARHIIIEKPKRGRSRPLNRRDFLNLAGRAGRLLREFHGNVWCLRPADWEESSYHGELLQEIGSAMDAAMNDGGMIIQEVLRNEATDKDLDYGEAALAKVYCDFVKVDRSLAESSWKTTENAATLAETEQLVRALKVTLPRELLDQNRSVRPDRLQDLYVRLRQDPEPGNLVPLRPGLAGSNDRMGAIIQTVQETLGGVDNNSYLFYKWLAIQWVYNTPLRSIIAQRLDYLQVQGNAPTVSASIRELLKTLEEAIRFRLVKYYMAYVSVLDLVLRERGDDATADAIEPFHVYLECGASDRVALNLIALGLSRATALALRDQVRFPDEATPEQCLAHLAVTELSPVAIPALCLREVRHMLGR